MPSDADPARRWRTYIRHPIAMAESFVSGIDYEAFKDDNLRLYAVTRCLEIISEVSRRLPEDMKARHPAIPWRKIAAAGNIYRHEYENVAAQAVWRTLTHDLRVLSDVVSLELSAPVSEARDEPKT